MCIKRSPVSLVVAAAVLTACWANIALGQNGVTIPSSSIANPSDAGVRAHTNVRFTVPPTGTPGIQWRPSCPGAFFRNSRFPGVHLLSGGATEAG